ncbi:hypothetical protein EDD21DRAFT_407726 [Dissophora ornata]|nr:hypothetical protein BGZ58_009539 [Dissophora ornata]KAI8597283.1 hypothetical protein EDD21DRAFT_407726 [Dissophora ornata]
MANSLSKTRDPLTIGMTETPPSETGRLRSAAKSTISKVAKIEDVEDGPVPIDSENEDSATPADDTVVSANTKNCALIKEDTSEKENMPPALDDINAAGIRPQKDTKNGHRSGGVKRKWSRPTQVVKLSEQEVEEEAESGQDSDDGIDVDQEDSDGDYGTRQRRQTSEHKRAPARFRRGQEPAMSEYEQLRLENIKRNQEMLQFLELPTLAADVHITALQGTTGEQKKLDPETPSALLTARKPRQYVKTEPKIIQPVRISKRLRGIEVTPLEIGENDTMDHGALRQEQAVNSDSHGNNRKDDDDDEDESANLMSGDLFFDEEIRAKAIRVDGHYKGWLNPEVMEKYGFEKNAQEAWEANGGGAFSFKDPLGMNDGQSTSRSKSSKRPKHDAKMVAKAMFKKNPNAFFYRHNEPGQEQWTGDWTKEEGVLFLKVASEHGCGDKWGLFASHIPHRVGYQCSNYYRQVVLPEGQVFDPNYEYTSRGKPIYCGKYNQRRD